ncbi:MAG: SpoVG family protein [Oscillospiraceae bacterium]|nr:SpoVG family protein [Oscillospiraceae bacterium]
MSDNNKNENGGVMPETVQDASENTSSDTKLNVRVFPIEEPQGNTLAFASVTVDDMVAIRGVRVFTGEDGGLFMSMPQSKQEKEGEVKYHDIAFPLTKDLRNQMRRAVIDEFKSPSEIENRELTPDAAKDAAARDFKLDVKVFPIDEPQHSTMAFASVTIDDKVAIRGIRVISGEDSGLFVAMPQSKQEKDGKNKYHDVAFPVVKGLRKQIRREILDEYKAKVSEKSASLDGKLREGAEKSAAHVPSQMPAAAKSRNAGVLE